MAIQRGKTSAPGMAWGDLDEAKKKFTGALSIDITGVEGQGKPSLALTAARMGPVGYIDIDQSVDRARVPDGKKMKGRIKTLPVRYSGGVSQEVTKSEAKEAWAALEANVGAAASDWASSLILDTGTEAWELLRLAEFGTVTPKGRTDKLYGPVNAKFRQFMRNIYRGHKKHLITIHQMKEEYIDRVGSDGSQVSARTGKMKEASMKEVPYLSDMCIRVHRKKSEFAATIEMCKLDPSLEGLELEESQLDIANIITVVPGTGEADWLR